MINQIIFISSFLFLIGLIALFRNANTSITRKGTVIVVLSCVINFAAFSNSGVPSAEGQVIGFVILLIAGLHYFIQKFVLSSDD